MRSSNKRGFRCIKTRKGGGLGILIVFSAALLACRAEPPVNGTAETVKKIVPGVSGFSPVPAGCEGAWEDSGEVIYYIASGEGSGADRTYDLVEYSVGSKSHRTVAEIPGKHISNATMSRDGRFFFYSSSSDTRPVEGTVVILSRERRGQPFNRSTVFKLGQSVPCCQLIYDDWGGKLYVGYPRDLTMEERGLDPASVKDCHEYFCEPCSESRYAFIDLSWEPYELEEFGRGRRYYYWGWRDVLGGLSETYLYQVNSFSGETFLYRRRRAGGPWERLVKTDDVHSSGWVVLPLNGEEGCLFYGKYYRAHDPISLKPGLNYVRFGGPELEDNRRNSQPELRLSRGYFLTAVQPPAGGGIVVVRKASDFKSRKSFCNVMLLDLDTWEMTPIFSYPKLVPHPGEDFVVAWLDAPGVFDPTEESAVVNAPYWVIR